MGALNPLFLVAAVAVGVPIFLHLFQRHQAQRLSFPALRYLERTEREHARRIRFRQLLLLVLRVTVLIVLVAAGARLFVRGRGAAHPPTAVVMILDNSMSSGRVIGEDRVLDHLKATALRTLASANPEDRVWVIRAGSPWLPLAPLTPADARALVESTDVTAARGDLTSALSRAGGLLAAAPLAPREIHLLSDLQATAFDREVTAPAGDIPVMVWAGTEGSADNRGLRRVLVGGGLPPLAGERTLVTVETTAGRDPEASEQVGVRIVVDGRIRGAATVPLGAAASIPLPPVQGGWISGWAETDPDDLRADDRLAFAFQARPAPVVSVGGDAGRFVSDALAVLEAAGRLRPMTTGRPDVVLAADGAGLERRDGAPVVVIPPADPVLLPGLNRRLAAAGVPWEYRRRGDGGSAPIMGDRLPESLGDAEASRWYGLAPVGDAGAFRTVARVAGAPWAVEGLDPSARRYLLLGSAMDAESTSLPTSASMVRFIDWLSSDWAGVDGATAQAVAGESLSAPRAATHAVLPSGDTAAIDGTRMLRATASAGFYTFLAGDSVLSVAAVNPDPRESTLDPLAAADLPGAVSRDLVRVDRDGAWDRAIFRERQGPELWRPLLLLALLLLAAEALVAAAGRLGFRPGVAATPVAVSHAAE